MKTLGKQLNITIDQDVQILEDAFDYYISKIDKEEYDSNNSEILTANKGDNWTLGYDGPSYEWGHKFNNKKKIPDSRAFAYVLATNDTSGSNSYWLYGDFLYNLCPWYEKLKQLSGDLNISEIGAMKHDGDIKPHIDNPALDNGQEKLSRLVTVLYTKDPDAHMLSWNGDLALNAELRKSKEIQDATPHDVFRVQPGEVYVFDIKVPHAIRCNNDRLILSVLYKNDINDVIAHFEKLGPVSV